jgi:hypothetical protein
MDDTQTLQTLMTIETSEGKSVIYQSDGSTKFSDNFTTDKSARKIIESLLVEVANLKDVDKNLQALFSGPQFKELSASVVNYHQMHSNGSQMVVSGIVNAAKAPEDAQVVLPNVVRLIPEPLNRQRINPGGLEATILTDQHI